MHEQAGKDTRFRPAHATMRDASNDEIAKMSAIIEPRMRDGLARAMARRFDEKQLADINRFFATPTAAKRSPDRHAMWVDPDTMRSMFGACPK